MLRRLAPLILLTLAPLITLAFLAQRMEAEEVSAEVGRFDAAARSRLEALSGRISLELDRRRTALETATASISMDPATLRSFVRETPGISGVIVLDASGQRQFPPRTGPVSEREKRLLERTRGLWEGKALAPSTVEMVANSIIATGATGWQPWFSGNGLDLIFWRRWPDGRRLGVEVPGVILLADLLALLPEGNAEQGSGRNALLDATGRVLYQWGAFDPQTAAPRVVQALAAPLEGWRLAFWPEALPAGGGLDMGTWAGLCALAVALVGLAVLLWRESQRAAREALERVTFVNQVSHELKTPLTSIRMYAELLGERLEDVLDEDPKAARQLSVIAEESQRLSRLIGNVLSFARDQRSHLKLRRGPGQVDTAVQAAVDAFAPACEAQGVELKLDLDAGESVHLDIDAVEQVVGNLLSNALKYGAGPVQITSRLEEGLARVQVADAGPGVPRAQKERIFEAFHRLDQRLEQKASGTGIGLTIARRLARLHGGDLVLCDGPEGQGACFELSVSVEQSAA